MVHYSPRDELRVFVQHVAGTKIVAKFALHELKVIRSAHTRRRDSATCFSPFLCKYFDFVAAAPESGF